MKVIARRDAADALAQHPEAAAILAAVQQGQGNPRPADLWHRGFPLQPNLRVLDHDGTHVVYGIQQHDEATAVIEFVGAKTDLPRRFAGAEIPSHVPEQAPQPTQLWYQRIQPTHWFLLVAALAAAPRLLPFWWGDEFYSVGFLVAPWAVWAVLRKEAKEPAPDAWRLAGMGLAAALVVIGWFLRDPVLSLWGVAAALGLHALEAGTWRSSWIPVLLLAITVPPPGSDSFLLASQKVVAVMAEGSLDLLGLPVTRDVFLLHGPNHSYSVEPLCTGLSGILASVLLVGMAASHLGTRRNMAMLSLAIAVGGTILLNIERIVLLVAITEVRGPSLIQGAFHEGVGLALSLLAFAAAIPPLLQDD